MSSEQESSFSSVLSINPHRNEYVTSVSSFLTKTQNPEYSKHQYVCSYLNTKNYINNQISISKNIPDEDIEDAINIKIYDELGLDQAVEYQFQFIETFNNVDGENRNFQVFIVDPLDIQTIFESSIEQVKYIDEITPSPLLIKALYSKEILDGDGTHCFIYFEDNDSFIAIYHEKDLVYTKSLKFSLEDMHERFCELYGEKVEYEDFIKFLATQNLKHTESDFKSYILKLYKEIFATVNDILTYAKKAFEIEKIEHIYVGSQIETASKIYEIAEVELGIQSNDFNFDYGLSSDGLFVDQIHALMHISTTIPHGEKYICNFSTFHRPPKFLQRESGKFIILLAASLLFAFAYPVTFWVLVYMQELQYELLSANYKEVHAEKTTREANIKNAQVEKEKALALLKTEQENYQSKKNTLIKIHDVKVNYPMKAKLITELVADLNEYTVKIEKIQYNQDENKKKFIFDLVASKDKKITRLLEHLTKKYDNKFQFALEDILLDEKRDLYFSELKVHIL